LRRLCPHAGGVDQIFANANAKILTTPALLSNFAKTRRKAGVGEIGEEGDLDSEKDPGTRRKKAPFSAFALFAKGEKGRG
jgi:hypothetical protein